MGVCLKYLVHACSVRDVSRTPATSLMNLRVTLVNDTLPVLMSQRTTKVVEYSGNIVRVVDSPLQVY